MRTRQRLAVARHHETRLVRSNNCTGGPEASVRVSGGCSNAVESPVMRITPITSLRHICQLKLQNISTERVTESPVLESLLLLTQTRRDCAQLLLRGRTRWSYRMIIFRPAGVV